MTWLPGLQDRDGWRLLAQAPDDTWIAWRAEGAGYVIRSGYTPTAPDVDDSVTACVLVSILAPPDSP